jgi:hypothetical protein
MGRGRNIQMGEGGMGGSCEEVKKIRGLELSLKVGWHCSKGVS